jgi:alpha-galactosidase
MPLTDVEIRRAKTKDKAYRMSDSGSLYLWVTPAGGELGRWSYTHEGKEKLMALAAEIFESQRIGDDTSGREWERTRRYGVNGLAHRIAQHRTFSHVDPDLVAITPAVGWRETSQWMDVVARSGISLFLSPDPASITPEIKSAMKDAMLLAAQQGRGLPLHPTSGTTPEEWQFSSFGDENRWYHGCGPEGASPFEV